MKIVWDEPKRIANLEVHKIDFADIGEEFFASAIVRPAHSGRHMAIGAWNGAIISVVFQVLGTEGVSIISARIADRKERKLLE